MAEHIHFMHNKTEEKLRVEKKNNGGRYSKFSEIPPSKKGGPYDDVALTDLRFVVQSRKPVYFKFVEVEHKDDITHIDGETGHPDQE